MKVHKNSAKEFHSMALAHLRAKHALQLLLSVENLRECRSRISQASVTTRRFRIVAIALTVFAMLLCSVHGFAQSTFGSIRGTVVDPSGAAISDAQITLHSIDENTDRVVMTDSSGGYSLDNVKARKYTIRAQRSGFSDTVLNNVVLAAGQDLRFPLTMAVAQEQTTVEVTSSAAEINTENATVGDSKNTAEIGQLPLNFRASTTSPLAALATSANVQQDSQGNFAIGGATSNQIGFSVDGIFSVSVFQSGVALSVNAPGSNPYPSSEGIAELKLTGEALIRLRNEEQIDDEVLRTLQRDLDFPESRVHTGSILAP